MTGRKIIFLFSMALLIAQTGCSSFFKRRECEGTNWYEYGQKVALSGRRLSGDQFVGDCRRVEAEIREADLDNGFKQGMARYCEPDQVFALGKSGEKFSGEMCDGQNPRVLVAQHAAGVVEYCRKSNGYSSGAAGRAYNGICPKEFEPMFIPEFNRGRKKYLVVLVVENEKKIQDLNLEIIGLQGERNLKAMESQNLLQPTLVNERVVEPTSGQYRDNWIMKVSDERKRAFDDVHWQVQRIESDISSKQLEQSKLRDRNREIQLETVGLDDRSP